MRLWKVVDEDIRKQAIDLHEKVLEGGNKNLDLWKRLVPFEWKEYYQGGGVFNLCGEVYSVIPEDKAAPMPKGWRLRKDSNSAVPDGRTKEGKAIDKEIIQNTVKIGYWDVLKLLGLEGQYHGLFTTPGVYCSRNRDEAYLKLDRSHDLSKDPRVEEVTESYVRKRMEEG